MDESDKNVQAIVAALASFCAVILICTVLFWACNRHKKKPTRPDRTLQTRDLLGRTPSAHLTSITIDESASFDPMLQISMAELVRATEMFSPDLIVGDGGFGWVYKATLSSGATVAVKKLSPDAFQGFREFRAEMETLGKLHHPNIVKILGYCASNSDRILVYEFVEKGSLDQWLYESSSSECNGGGGGGGGTWSTEILPLSWDTRVKIITGVASGLSYLHGLPKPIIHRDIKASNILLDANFEAHIADFGLARRIDSSHTHVSTQAAGTMGYMPPEYKEGLTLATPRVDIYSFGILMFEVFTGRRPNLPVAIHVEDDHGWKGQKEVGLMEWMRRMLVQGKEMEMVDSSISSQGLNEAMVKDYFGIASLCCNEHSKQRPAMTQVAEMLKRLSMQIIL